MPINDPHQHAYVMRPRLRIMSGDNFQTEIPQATGAQVASNNNFQADRFAAVFVPTLTGVGSLKWWSEQTTVKVDIQVGFVAPGSTAAPSWKSMLQGEADKLTMDVNRFLIDIEGRDFTARFIDNKIADSYVNQSSGDIVKRLAESRGLKAQISTAPGLAGRFWSGDKETSPLNQGSKNTTEWDMIVSLAKKEGYDAFVQGDTLYFQPETLATADPYVWLHEIDDKARQTGNVHNLKMDRVLTIAKGLSVQVKSWHAKTATGFLKTSSTAASIGPDGKSLAQKYNVQHPNMTEDEAQSYADRMAAEIAKHEKLIAADMPGDLLLTPRVMVKLQGTGTAFDQVYYPVSVVKEISVSAGFTMRASCKNRAAENAEGSQPKQTAPLRPPVARKSPGAVGIDASGGVSA